MIIGTLTVDGWVVAIGRPTVKRTLRDTLYPCIITILKPIAILTCLFLHHYLFIFDH